jgi:peptidoglycan hydrolase CwlO-like protein
MDSSTDAATTKAGSATTGESPDKTAAGGDKAVAGQATGTATKGAISEALTALSGQDGQKVFAALSSALQGTPGDLKQILSDIDEKSAEIDKVLADVEDRDKKIQEIDAALKALQQEIPDMNAQIEGIRGRITVRTDDDVKKLFGLDLLEDK